MFYHATYNAHLESIKEKGLIPNFCDNWGGLSSEQNGVYLSSDPFFAISCAESADYVEDDVYDSGIVVLAIDEKDLDQDKLSIDKNLKDEDGETSFLYAGTIKNFKAFPTEYFESYDSKEHLENKEV